MTLRRRPSSGAVILSGVLGYVTALATYVRRKLRGNK